MEIDDSENEAEKPTAWPLVKVSDVVAAVLVGAVVLQIIGAAISAAGFPHSEFPGANSVSLYSRLFAATLWAGLPTGLLLLASIAVLAIPRLVWDVPASDSWTGFAPKAAVVTLGVASLAAISGLLATGNTLWNSPQRSPLDSWNVALSLAGAAVNGLVAVLSWFAVDYVREDPPAL